MTDIHERERAFDSHPDYKVNFKVLGGVGKPLRTPDNGLTYHRFRSQVSFTWQLWRSGRGGLCTGLNYGHLDAEWEVAYQRMEFHGDREKMSGVTV